MQRSEMLMGLLIGAVAGAATALLLAPARGADSRRRIMDAAESAGDKAGSVVNQARRHAANTIQRVADATQDLAESVADKARDLQSMVAPNEDQNEPHPARVHLRRSEGARSSSVS